MLAKIKNYTTFIKKIVVFILIINFATFDGICQEKTTPIKLRCEYLKNPLGIDTQNPRLSWQLEGAKRGAAQTAYRILVATDSTDILKNENLVWDTQKVSSNSTNNIKYSGPSLKPHQKYYWKVYIWNEDGEKSMASNVASWETALFGLKNWKGKWIGDGQPVDFKPAPYFRKEINLNNPVKKASLFIAGLGYYELRINGEKVGNRLLDPAYTDYDESIKYTSYDVTKHLNKGNNALGVILGNGWYNEQSKAVWNFHEAPWRHRPAFLMNMLIEYQNGTTRWIVSDTTWKTTSGPIIFNNIYSGEYFDARKSLGNWDKPSYQDDQWAHAVQAQVSGGKLEFQMMPPIKATDTLQPVEFRQINDSIYVFDMGQNFTGWSEISVSGPRGTTLQLKHGEVLKPNNRLDQANIGKYTRFEDPNEQVQTDQFILSGSGIETFSPRFTYHGFRYVEVIADRPVSLNKNSLKGIFFHTDLERIGHFSSSDTLLNNIFKAGIWSYLSNLHGIPTDCPHREKNGWTGDGHIAAEIGLYNYDAILFYEKWIGDFIDAQHPSGELPGIIPTAGWGYHWGNGPAWDSGLLLIPWYIYKYYGDDTLIKKYYDHYKKYFDYLTFRAQNNIQYWGLGDWSPADTETPATFTSTCYYYTDARLLARFAEINGEPQEKKFFEARAKEIKESINQKFFNRKKYQYANGSQTAQSAALYHNVVPAGLEDNVAEILFKKVKDNNFHLDVGLLGSKYLLNVLVDHGYADAAYKIATQTTRPSWGWWISQGMTTFQESWGIGPSRNHVFKGEILAWMYKSLAGINPNPEKPGFKQVLLTPHFVDGLEKAKADYRSIHGQISCGWHKAGNVILLDIQLPPNTEGLLKLPVDKGKTVFEGGKELNEDTEHIKIRGYKNDKGVHKLYSGTYEFRIE